MAFDASKFETVHQVVGGIRTGRYDWPDAGQNKKYEMNIIVHPDEAAINGLLAPDGDLVPVHL